MTDGYGRTIDYLRISLTDKCNFRCSYCMPKQGVEQLSHEEILTLEEIGRIASILVSLGIRKIRLTGGEPLVRKNITGLVRNLRKLPGLEKIVMTTNGSLLSDKVQELKEAGLDGVNISLDTGDPAVFERLCGRDLLSGVFCGIEAAKEAGMPYKINCVPIRGFNEDELVSIAEIAKKDPVDVRFIELMPLGCGASFTGMLSEEVLSRLEKAYGRGTKELDPSGDASEGPAHYYRFAGFSGRIGLISPLSHPFCKSCNRLRLTAEGFLKLCLERPDGVDLRGPLRSGKSDEELREIINNTVIKKPASHSFSRTGEAGERRKMVQIGG